MLMENSNIEIIGGGLFFTEIEIQNDNEKFVPSESDKEAIRKNIEEIECLKTKKKSSVNVFAQNTNDAIDNVYSEPIFYEKAIIWCYKWRIY